MKPTFQRVQVYLTQEGDWYVAQCIEVDVASQGRTEEEALSNLREALELFFEAPTPTTLPKLRTLDLVIA